MPSLGDPQRFVTLDRWRNEGSNDGRPFLISGVLDERAVAFLAAPGGGPLMALFRRHRPVDLGTFEPPTVPPIAPIERVVEEGVLISASTVRMAIKNRLIVAALRDRVDYDPVALAAAARAEFATLARENDETAQRLDHGRPASAGTSSHGPDTEGLDTRSEAHRRRPQVHRLLAAALRKEAEDRDALTRIVESARDDAWQEIGQELMSRLHARALTTDYQPDNDAARRDSIREFVENDLADLLTRMPAPPINPWAGNADAPFTSPSDRYLQQWIRAGEAGDVNAAVDALAENVVLVSPITDRFVFTGRDQLRDLLNVAFAVVNGITYSERLRNGSTAALFYRGRIGDIPLHEAQLLQLDDDGRILRVTLFVRPLPALTALVSELGPRLARQQDRAALARLLAVSAVPLHRMALTAEKSILPRAAPE